MSSAGALVSQIGLSPLSFAMAGLAHEASQTVKQNSRFVLGWPLQIIIHFAASTALASVIVGAWDANKAAQTADQIMGATNLACASSALFLVVLIFVTVQIIGSLRQQRTLLAEKHPLYAVWAVLPAFALRVLFLFVGAMVNSNTRSVLKGAPFAALIAMEVLLEFTR